MERIIQEISGKSIGRVVASLSATLGRLGLSKSQTIFCFSPFAVFSVSLVHSSSRGCFHLGFSANNSIYKCFPVHSFSMTTKFLITSIRAPGLGSLVPETMQAAAM